MNKYKFYSLATISLTLVLLFSMAILTYIIDPFFHYHFPNSNFDYTISDERYQNDGILRNFDYDAIITGTSMTENFKTSEFDNLFNVKSVKTPFHGASYKELNDNLKRAIKYNENIKYIIRGVDLDQFYKSKDYMKYSIKYLEYLVDDNYFNDVSYLLNKTIFIKNVLPTLKTLNTDETGTLTNFDNAYSWHYYRKYVKELFGAKSVLKSYTRSEKVEDNVEITDEMIEILQENIDANLVSIVKENPNIEFYYFLTPYSILFWDNLNQTNTIEKHLYGERMIIESLLEYENMHLFSFNDLFDVITNLDYYCDWIHYGEDINWYMLESMANNEHRLTKENYEEYLSKIEKFYKEYDYNRLFE